MQTYRSDTRIHNWSEDVIRIEDDLATFQRRRAGGELLLTKLHAKMAAACAPVQLTPAHADGYLRYGDTITLHSVLTGTALAANMDKKVVSEQLAYQVTGTADLSPVGRTAFTVLRPGGGENAADGSIVNYADHVLLALHNYEGAPVLFLQTQRHVLPSLTKSNGSKKDDVVAVTVESKACVWKFVAAEARLQLVSEGSPVSVHSTVGLQHMQTHLLLSTDLVKLRTIFGIESEVHAQLSRNARLTDLALPKTYIDKFVPDASQWVIATDGFTPPPPQPPLPTVVSAPPVTALGSSTTSLAHRAAYLASSHAEPAKPTAPTEPAPAAPPAPPAPPAPAAAAPAPGAELGAAPRFPFYAQLVTDAMAATGVPADALELEAVQYGPGGSEAGLVAGPLGSPGVLLVGEGWAVDAQLAAQAATLAASGYRVLVPRLPQPGDEGYAGALQAVAHGVAYLREAEGAPSVGMLGLSHGGALALAAAAQIREIACVAFCYGIDGSRFDPRSLAAVPLQGHFGGDDGGRGLSDPHAALALQQALAEEGGAGCEVFVYPRAGHGFLNDAPGPYASFEERAARTGERPFESQNGEEVWARLLGFFAHRLPR